MEGGEVTPSPAPEKISPQGWKETLELAFESQGKIEDVGVMEQGRYLYFATGDYYRSQLFNVYSLHHAASRMPQAELAGMMDRERVTCRGV